MTFLVKAAANASVALTAGKYNFTDGAMYEVVLGVEDNTRTIIRWENSGYTYAWFLPRDMANLTIFYVKFLLQ